MICCSKDDLKTQDEKFSSGRFFKEISINFLKKYYERGEKEIADFEEGKAWLHDKTGHDKRKWED